jgi:YVTN family beta-propeller protein
MRTARIDAGRRWPRKAAWLLLTIAIVAAGGIAVASMTPIYPGPQGDGTGITPEGWRITPAGTQTPLGNGPIGMATSPDGSQLLIVNAGFQHNSIMAVDESTGIVTQTIQAVSDGVWYGGAHGYYSGVAYSPDGTHAYAADGPGSAIHVYDIANGTLTERQEIQIKGAVWPAGIAVSANGGRLYVAANLADSLLVVSPAKRKVVARVPVGHLPYAVTLNGAGTRAYVTDWGAATVSVLDTKTDAIVATIPIGLHPSALAVNPTTDEVYAAGTDADTVSVIGTRPLRVRRTIDLHPHAGARVGTSPDALAVSPDGKTLYVANAGNNDVAVVALATSTDPDRVSGLIPTGYYPTAVALVGSRIDVVSMYGLGTGPVGPYWYSASLRDEYIAAQMQGTLSRIPLPSSARLTSYTTQVRANNAFDVSPPSVSGNPIPPQEGGSSPIKHVIYVMKENRTYDQVLGDLPQGNGDPAYEMYPADVTPNQHALAERFVTLDNFYTDGAVSADGWSWSTEAYANTYVDKNWPQDYGIYGRPYDFGGPDNETAGLPGAPDDSFLWDRLTQVHVSFRNYGFFMEDTPVTVPTSMPNLQGTTDLNYTGWDLNIKDQVRADEWLKEFNGYVACSCLPSMEFVYFPQDHTSGTATTKPKPTAMVADNDLALGRLVDAVSHSKYWSSTAIFVVEDDAQDGPDHVSGHRTIAFAISPYTQTGTVDSTFYSTVSMLRSIELILGLQPLTLFDAAATPMYASFSSTPNFASYSVSTPGASLTAVNGPNATMAAASRQLDFSRPDASSEQLLNRILWRAAHHTKMPHS